MKEPVVLDCSITLAWCFSDEISPLAESALDYIKKNEAVVPALWGLELINGLLQARKKNRITLEGILSFLELFAKLPIRSISIPVSDCFTSIYALAEKHSLSSYDASYLHLAIREKLKLATLDKSLQAAARKHGVLWK